MTASNNEADKLLKFVSFESTVESGFWYCLQDKKLNLFKLDESARAIKGFYTNSNAKGLMCYHNVDFNAFNETSETPALCFPTVGKLLNKNTIESFKNTNFSDLMHREGAEIWQSIVTGEAIHKPELLVRFFIVSYADLKKYKFHYWFCFPAVVLPTPAILVDSKPLSERFDSFVLNNVQSEIHRYFKTHSSNQSFFLLATDSNDFEGSHEIGFEAHELVKCPELLSSGKHVIFVFCDPSTSTDYPGWPLRNFVALVSYYWLGLFKSEIIDFLCFRECSTDGERQIGHSLHLKLKLSSISLLNCCPKITGWEKNKVNKLGPRVVNLENGMDPTKLAESSVNLNLKLMRWRLMPSLDLEKIAQCKCLLLGAGTLGCSVARTLLGWGVVNITFVDNGKVSFSNPVRQTLFEFSDCATNGGRYKAIAAAERLKKIYPGVDSTGIVMSIPMPGHPVHNNEKLIEEVRNDVEKLESLIESHDVVFLLMDTRESRWLPTVIGAAKNKLVINAALGFDSYMVMRHGVKVSSDDGGTCCKLGCYFCNDVVAPGNSTHDRTLDQQCTVSRPGVSMIASALAVELMVSVLQHPAGKSCFPEGTDHLRKNEHQSCLGPVPHQIRGFLSSNQMIYPTTTAFDKCTACCDIILDLYRERRFSFLMDVFNSTHKYLEDLTGLTLLHESTNSAECDIIEFSDSDDDI